MTKSSSTTASDPREEGHNFDGQEGKEGGDKSNKRQRTGSPQQECPPPAGVRSPDFSTTKRRGQGDGVQLEDSEGKNDIKQQKATSDLSSSLTKSAPRPPPHPPFDPADSMSSTVNVSGYTSPTTSPNYQHSPSKQQEGEEIIENHYMKQAERKRSKEKKRRQDISNAMEKLTDTLLKVDPDNLFRHNNQIYFGDGVHTLSNRHNNPLNRTEIINHATNMIAKLAMENERNKFQGLQLQNMILSQQGRGPTSTSSSSSILPFQQQNTYASSNSILPTSSFSFPSLQYHHQNHNPHQPSIMSTVSATGAVTRNQDIRFNTNFGAGVTPSSSALQQHATSFPFLLPPHTASSAAVPLVGEQQGFFSRQQLQQQEQQLQIQLQQQQQQQQTRVSNLLVIEGHRQRQQEQESSNGPHRRTQEQNHQTQHTS